MPRNSSRKATEISPSGNSSDMLRAASGKAATKELERIDHLFYSYASNSSGLIDPDGIESLCSDLEVDHTDVRILMLAWKMQAEKQGYFTLFCCVSVRTWGCGKMGVFEVVRTHEKCHSFLVATLTSDEWRRGLKALRADTTIKLKKALVDLEREVRRPANFVDFYSFAFRYCLTEEKQKSIDIESICVLLDLVIGPHFPPQVDALIQYLKVQIDYKVINMDQWMGFYRFCNEISFPDLDNYDPELAWPLILDNFVEWMGSNLS